MIVFTSIDRTTQSTTDQHHPVLHSHSYHYMDWITTALEIAKGRQQMQPTSISQQIWIQITPVFSAPNMDSLNKLKTEYSN